MKKTASIITLFIFSVVIFTACSKKDSTPAGGGGGGITFSCTGISPKFAADVQPIITSVCATNSNCHASGSVTSGGPFTNYTQVNAKKLNIRAQILAGTMPKSGTISQAQINAIICWIDGGALNN